MRVLKLFCIAWLMAIVLPLYSYAQGVTISGQVSDTDGNGLPGVSVIVKGTTYGTISDAEGQFTLKWPNDKASVFVFSYIGMQTQEIRYKGQPQLNVTMYEDAQLMNEVVVTGVQTIEKGRATGSFSILKQDDLAGIYSNNLLEKLEGTTPGLVIDSDNNITIRGLNSMNTETQPLIVVDGFPVESTMLSLNPADIEQVTVLKDAASASIWGIRAANGVIVITTKRGSKDKKLKVSYNTTLTYARKVDLNDLHVLSSDQYVRLLFDDYYNSEPYASGKYGAYNELEQIFADYWYDGSITEEEAMAQVAELGSYSNRSTIRKYFFRNAFTQQHNISLQAGGEKSSTYLSLNYDQNKSRLVGDEYHKVNLMLNTDYHLTKNFTAKVNVRASEIWEKRNGDESVLDYEPWMRILNDDGSYYDESIRTINKTYQEACTAIGFKDWHSNVLENMRMNDMKTNTYNLTAGLTLEWEPIKNLKLSSQGTYEKYKTKDEDYYCSDHYYVRNLVNTFTEVTMSGGYPVAIVENHVPVEGGIKDITNNDQSSYSLRNQIAYEFDVKDFNIRAMAGNEIYQLKGDGYSQRLWGYQDEYQTSTWVNESELVTGVSGYNGRTQKLSTLDDGLEATLERYVSWYGTASVGYKDLYNLFGSIRLDQTNLLTNADKYRNNPSWSVGAKWNISNEKFFKKSDILNSLALRASYGLSGNINKTTSPDMTGVFATDSYTALNVLYVTNPVNPSLGWEKTYTTNIGVEAGLFNDRLNVSLEFYNRKSTDLLYSIQNDPTTGWSSFSTNAGNMVNRGLELSLQGTILHTKDWSWDANFSMSYNHNKITKYNYSTSAYYKLYSSQFVKGQPINHLATFRYGGLDENGEPTFLKKDGTQCSWDELGSLEDEDLIYKGSFNPPITGSLSSTVRWKDLSLSVLFTYQFGGWMRMPSPYTSGGLYTEWCGEDYRWMSGADNTGKWVPKIYDGYGGNEWANSYYWDCLNYSDKMVERSNLIRLKSLRLNYDISRLLNKIHIAGGSVGVSGENLWYWASNREDLDPDTVVNGYFGTTLQLSNYVPRVIFNLSVNF